MSCKPQRREWKVTSTWFGSYPTAQRQRPWDKDGVRLPTVSSSAQSHQRHSGPGVQGKGKESDAVTVIRMRQK